MRGSTQAAIAAVRVPNVAVPPRPSVPDGDVHDRPSPSAAAAATTSPEAPPPVPTPALPPPSAGRGVRWQDDENGAALVSVREFEASDDDDDDGGGGGAGGQPVCCAVM